MNQYKGIIWIRNITSGSKSDGNLAFFIDEEFNHYKLYREGVFEINDNFFYPYNLKNVQITGEIQKKKFMKVDSIVFDDDTLKKGDQ
jgi:hypothetical protein